jgi:nicotinamide-nucleotide amidase
MPHLQGVASSPKVPSFTLLAVNAEIIAIGSELLTPYRQDTNSLFLTGKLNQLGIEVIFKTVVGDDRQQLVSAAELAVSRADVIIFMGGLGPTEDDLTREAVAEALGVELKRDPALVDRLEKWFAKRGAKMSANNQKQADVLAGASVLPNANGTAPGQWLSGKYDGREKIIMLLPGPPHEIKPLFEEQCMERLRDKVPPLFIATRELRVAMMGESACDARIAPIYGKRTEVQTTILAGAGEIQIHLRSRAASLDAAQEAVDSLSSAIEEELGDSVFSRSGESLEQIVSYLLQMRNLKLAAAESCTGGMLAERITSISGSSRYFLGGAVVYSNELKTELANVSKELIEKHGAVSQEVAIALAEGIRQRCKADVGIGITGIAGPTGGTETKPVGLVYHAVAGVGTTDVVERRFPGDRQRIRWFASQQALDMVRKKLIQ